MIYELTGAKSTVVLDLTLVRDMVFWSSVTTESKLDISKGYIFVAEYAISRPLIEDAEKLPERYHLPIYCLYPPKGKRIHARTFLGRHRKMPYILYSMPNLS